MTYIVLMDHGARGLVDIEGVEGDADSLAKLVEVLGTLGQRVRGSKLVVIINNDVRMPLVVQRSVLVEAIGKDDLADHDEDEGWGQSKDEGMGAGF